MLYNPCILCCRRHVLAPRQPAFLPASFFVWRPTRCSHSRTSHRRILGLRTRGNHDSLETGPNHRWSYKGSCAWTDRSRNTRNLPWYFPLGAPGCDQGVPTRDAQPFALIGPIYLVRIAESLTGQTTCLYRVDRVAHCELHLLPRWTISSFLSLRDFLSVFTGCGILEVSSLGEGLILPPSGRFPNPHGRDFDPNSDARRGERGPGSSLVEVERLAPAPSLAAATGGTDRFPRALLYVPSQSIEPNTREGRWPVVKNYRGRSEAATS